MMEVAGSRSQLRQLLTDFNDLRLKCYILQQSVPECVHRLSKYEQLALMIQGKIKDREEDTQCRQRLERAIGELEVLRGNLTLLKNKKDEIGMTPSSPSQESAENPKNQQSVCSFEDKLDKWVGSGRQRNNDFRPNELMHVWKPSKQTETASEAADRLNRVILNLTCKVKGLVREELQDHSRMQMHILPQFCNVLQELERYKMFTEELLMKNDLLRDELLKVKAEIFVSKYRPRYYRPDLKEFGCNTDKIDPRLELKSKRWSSTQKIQQQLQQSLKHASNILSISKQSLTESLLLDAEESRVTQSKFSYSQSDNSMVIGPPDPQVCKQLVINSQKILEVPPNLKNQKRF